MPLKIRLVLYILFSSLLTFFGLQYLLSLKSDSIASVIVDCEVGGIGNQLFRYAFAYRLANQLNIPLHLQVNLTKLQLRSFKPKNREFMLDHFQLNQQKFSYIPAKSITSIEPSRKFSYREQHFWKGEFPTDKVLVIDDYFESAHFFEPVVQETKKQFEFNFKFNDQISSPASAFFASISSNETESIGVHFRLGDFQGKGLKNRVLSFSFQINAMKLIRSILKQDTNNIRPAKILRFFIFSDDIEFVKSNVNFGQFNSSVIFVSNVENSIFAFYLLSKCKHQIVPNSTFSWWAAFLNKNPNKVVISANPKNKLSFYDKYNIREVRNDKILIGTKFAYPKSWILLNPFKNVN